MEKWKAHNYPLCLRQPCHLSQLVYRPLCKNLVCFCFLAKTLLFFLCALHRRGKAVSDGLFACFACFTTLTDRLPWFIDDCVLCSVAHCYLRNDFYCDDNCCGNYSLSFFNSSHIGLRLSMVVIWSLSEMNLSFLWCFIGSASLLRASNFDGHFARSGLLKGRLTRLLHCCTGCECVSMPAEVKGTLVRINTPHGKQLIS